MMTPGTFLHLFRDTDLPEFARSLLPAPSRPSPGETAVVALECPRTAALCFDRVWSIPIYDTGFPPEIGFSSTSEAELVFALYLHISRRDITRIANCNPEELAEAVMAKDAQAIFASPTLASAYAVTLTGAAVAGSLGADWLPRMTRTLSEDLQKAVASRVAPLYNSESTRDAEYKPGDRGVIVTALRQLNVVDEEALSWNQVLEFRRDKRARADYQRLVHWLDSDMAERSTAFIVDEMGVRLDNYYQAIKKHGLKTRLAWISTPHNSPNTGPVFSRSQALMRSV